jgi:hypothetical protein
MDLCTPDFHSMFNYFEGDKYDPRSGYTKLIVNLADAFEFLCNVEDMGAGVMLVDFNLPRDRGHDHIGTVFRESKELQRLSTPAKNLGYKVESLGHLGGDGCYFGVIQCGADLENQYRLIIFSYDQRSATRFHVEVCDLIEGAIVKQESETEDLASRMRRPVQSNQIATKMRAYLNAIYFSNLNRRIIAATILRELHIPIETETIRISDTYSVVAITADGVSEEYLTTFLEESTMEKRARLYSSAYRIDDLINGAPWCLGESIGFRTYERTISIPRPTHLQIHGAPMGPPFDYGCDANGGIYRDSNSKEEEKLAEVRRKVLWNTNIDVLLVADYRKRMDTHAALNILDSTYYLRDNRFRTWRTIIMYLAHPEIQKIPLPLLLKFSTGSTVTVHYEKFREIMDMWMIVRQYYDSIQAEDADIKLPPLKNLFQSQSADKKYASIDKTTFESLLNIHRLVQSQTQTQTQIPNPVPPPIHVGNGIANGPASHLRFQSQSQSQSQNPPPDDRHKANGIANGGKRRKPARRRTSMASTSESEMDVHGSGDEALYNFGGR